jgi:molybdate transport system regulatory protein
LWLGKQEGQDQDLQVGDFGSICALTGETVVVKARAVQPHVPIHTPYMPKTRKKTSDNAMAVGRSHQGLQIKGRIWIEQSGETYLSWGRVVLLERIDQYGSVSAAAKSMEMSFSHAWNLVKAMNDLAPVPLVEKQAGGRSGGGAWLTEAGRTAVADFWALVERFQGWIGEEQL